MTSTPENKQPQGEGSDVARWASLIGGGAMVLLGLGQGSLRGALTAIAGGTLAYQATKWVATSNGTENGNKPVTPISKEFWL